MYETPVSIALCTFNGEPYIGDLLDSLRKQAVQPCELAVCDDCSTDSTIELQHKFKSIAPFNVNIILNKEHLGVLHNLEVALSACNEKHIALCGQDDAWKSLQG